MEENERKVPFEDLRMPWWGYLLIFAAIYFGLNVLVILLELGSKLIFSAEQLSDEAFVNNLINSFQVIAYAILLLIFCIVFRKSLKDILSRLKNSDTWIWFGLGLAILYGGNIFYSQIIDKLGISTSSANQDSVNDMIYGTPFVGFLFVCILAPIMEELMFRMGIYRAISFKNKTLAFIVTVVAFASIHLLASIEAGTLLADLSSFPIYLLGAFGLTLVYHKTHSIVASILTHMAYNTISFLSILLISNMPELQEAIHHMASFIANIF